MVVCGGDGVCLCALVMVCSLVCSGDGVCLCLCID